MNHEAISVSIAIDTPYKLLEVSKEIADAQSYQYSYGSRPGFTPLLIAHQILESIFEHIHMVTLNNENSEEYINTIFSNLREKGILTLESEAQQANPLGEELVIISIYELLVTFIFEFLDLLSSLNLLNDTLLTCLSVNERTIIVLVNDYTIGSDKWLLN